MIAFLPPSNASASKGCFPAQAGRRPSLRAQHNCSPGGGRVVGPRSGSGKTGGGTGKTKCGVRYDETAPSPFFPLSLWERVGVRAGRRRPTSSCRTPIRYPGDEGTRRSTLHGRPIGAHIHSQHTLTHSPSNTPGSPIGVGEDKVVESGEDEWWSRGNRMVVLCAFIATPSALYCHSGRALLSFRAQPRNLRPLSTSRGRNYYVYVLKRLGYCEVDSGARV